MSKNMSVILELGNVMLIDTDVIIWFMRGNQKAYDILNNCREFNISVVTYIELLQGLRNKAELSMLKKAFHTWRVRIIHLSEEISLKAMAYIERYFLSHSLTMADALIAATAISHNLPILTGDTRHYSCIAEVEVVPFES